MPDWIRYALAGLAVYRAAQLVSIDYGPFDVFQRVRDAAGVSDRGRDGRPTRELGRMLACPYCIGLWLALLAGLACIWPAPWSDGVLIVLGLAGIQTYLQGARQAR